jgi:ankyrin repeat protein
LHSIIRLSRLPPPLNFTQYEQRQRSQQRTISSQGPLCPQDHPFFAYVVSKPFESFSDRLANFASASDRNPYRLLTAKDQSGYQPLHYAAASGNVQFLRLLLDIFSNFPSQYQQLIDSTDHSGNSALHFAVERSLQEVISILVKEANANTNLVNNRGLTCLHLAASFPPSGQSDSIPNNIARFLLANGADSNIADVTGATPLHTAASLGNEALVGLLIENGASPDVCDEEGETPLFYAVRDQRSSVVRKLCQYGVQTNTKNMDGETVLETALAVGDSAMVELLETLAQSCLPQSGKGQNANTSTPVWNQIRSH